MLSSNFNVVVPVKCDKYMTRILILCDDKNISACTALWYPAKVSNNDVLNRDLCERCKLHVLETQIK